MYYINIATTLTLYVELLRLGNIKYMYTVSENKQFGMTLCGQRIRLSRCTKYVHLLEQCGYFLR